MGITFVLLLYWISYAWLTARRGRMTDDPLVFAIKDRVSQVLIALMGVAAWLAGLKRVDPVESVTRCRPPAGVGAAAILLAACIRAAEPGISRVGDADAAARRV